jgi:hypothetical protein
MELLDHLDAAPLHATPETYQRSKLAESAQLGMASNQRYKYLLELNARLGEVAVEPGPGPSPSPVHK